MDVGEKSDADLCDEDELDEGAGESYQPRTGSKRLWRGVARLQGTRRTCKDTTSNDILLLA